PYEGTAEELGAKLTMLGLELDELCRPFAELEELVVGHVVECGRHPDSDHLSVCRVDLGSEVVDIVCGAPNVAQGQYVVVAPVGSTLPGGLKIKKAKLRGQPSNGMICSERELGLSEDHSGIMVLNELLEGPFTPGDKAVDVMKLDTEVLDISITPNRGDCLSVLGLAREAALAFNLPLTMPKIDYTGIDTSSKALDSLKLEVQSGDISPLYLLRCIEDLKVGKSPAWMRWRLQAVGQRSISNLVDVTNYIMFELGQPLHSFDLHKVAGGRVGVALAKDGEKLVTLDGQERILTGRDITIRDAEKAIGLGGVMGGLNSEIDDNSSAVMLEAAVFNMSNIRHTSKRLGLPSEAAYRFERGVNQGMTAYALERAAVMIAGLGQGRVSAGVLGSELKPWSGPYINLRRKRAESLVGVAMDAPFCVDTLEKLGCTVNAESTTEGEETWNVTAPSHRLDLEREADLIEELARVYGYERMPETLPLSENIMETSGKPLPKHKFFSGVKRWAAGLGLNEVINYSFVGHKDLDFLGLPAEGRISIMNPLTSEMDVLRPVLAPGLLNTLRNNLSQGVQGLRVFETASSFTAAPESETTASENMLLGLMLYGDRFSAAWPQTTPQSVQEMDYQDLRGLVEHLCAHLHLGCPEFVMSEAPRNWLAPCVEVKVGDESFGYMGKVKPDIADAFHARKEVWMAELDLDKLYELFLKVDLRFRSLPVFPPVRRDITVIAPKEIQAGAILAAIRKSSPASLENAVMVDLFEPKGGTERNLTFRLTYRAADRTLQDNDVDKLRDKLVAALTKELPVRV
ncbi:phenylalanine--tRNA ligase subunit beta, partial [Desulfovibrio sp. OttesenSCG-928-C06]|nr:phenylalanine--tRNA ligase subunit beta [Desulfovibrio sp. OttesenSCG-928-C06]